MRRVFALVRYSVQIPVVATLLGAIGLMLFETLVLFTEMTSKLEGAAFTLKEAKQLAVGLIEAIDVFLISIAAYVMSLSLYALFVDGGVPMPAWLQVNDLEDLKANLISIVIAVLGVLFLRQAISWESGMDILFLGVGIALVIATLTFFVTRKGTSAN